MSKMSVSIGMLALLLAAPVLAQQPTRDYYVGNEGVGLPIAPPEPTAETPDPPNTFAPASGNVRMFGALYMTESCAYDATRGVIVAPARGVSQAVRANDAWVALINHDGSVHTPRWIGVQNSGAARDTMRPRLVLNEPFGSFIHNGALYLSDRDGGTPDPARTGQLTPSLAVIRVFDMATGWPLREIAVPGSAGLNDLAVAADGTIYGTNTGVADDPNSWAVWKISPNGTATRLVQGAPLNRPNGIEMDNESDIVVVNIGDANVLTFAPNGRLRRTEQAAQAGNDGLVIMPDGVKFVSSVLHGGVSMIAPDQPARLIAENIPNAASMCYDSGANQLVIPVNPNNGLAFVSLDGVWAPRR